MNDSRQKCVVIKKDKEDHKSHNTVTTDSFILLSLETQRKLEVYALTSGMDQRGKNASFQLFGIEK